jgi:pilus assembly protein FimV
MQIPRLRWLARASLFCVAWALCGTAVTQVVVGDADTAATFGRPLNFQALLRLQPGEVLERRCVRAEVSLGDRRLPDGDVRVELESSAPGSARVRVRTRQAVEDPIVSVWLHAGCESRISRNFVLIADRSSDAGRPAPAADSAAATQPASPLPPAMPAIQAAPGPARPASVSSPTRETRRTADPAAQPRLRLDSAEPAAGRAPTPGVVVDEILDQAFEAVALATAATRAAQAQAQVQARRIAELERTVGTLQTRAESAEASSLAAQRRAAQAEREARWLLPVAVGAGVLALLAAWLAWQLRELRRIRASGWARSQGGGTVPPPAPSQLPTMPVSLSGREATMPARLSPRSEGSASAWPRASTLVPELPAETPTAPGALPVTPSPPPASAPASPTAPGRGAEPVQRTDVLPFGTAATAVAPRDVSIEELIDLEQQAEFFVVLGQDDEAIDLLVEHLRNTGGGSPLPYLKLLEIYRRLGDREAYERTRTRFNRRFNAYAAEWDAEVAAAQSLEDYPEVMQRLQQVWSRPLDAMAELEALLFRRSRGELFDISAYREVLFLYSLARDLLDREAADTGNVDLLLPLQADGDPASEARRMLDRSGPVSDFGDDAHLPTAPVDLDVTLPEAPRSSIFDPLFPNRPRG